MKKVVMLLAILFAALTIGCSENVSTGTSSGLTYDGESYQATLSDITLSKFAYEDLSDDEKASLKYMREEEKLARDVYLYFFEKYNLPVFRNIANSEQAHTNAIKYLLNKYSITDPVTNDERGVFTNTDLQALYNNLIQMGNVSDVEALKVGALIEEVDIVDLQNGLSNIDNADITFVYNNLMKGSANHLKAFTRNLSFRGINYTPTKLSESTYQEIVK